MVCVLCHCLLAGEGGVHHVDPFKVNCPRDGLAGQCRGEIMGQEMGSFARSVRNQFSGSEAMWWEP